MRYWPIKLSLMLTYLVFAILLNSVGTVILQMINMYEVSKTSASVLEGFKDIPIAVVSFIVASYLPKFGYKNAMILGLLMVALACYMMPLIPSFSTTKALFLTVGVSFALIKISVYASIGLITDNSKQHASLLNSIEGIFMVGVLLGYWLFGFYVDSNNPQSSEWLRVYWILCGACLVNVCILIATPFNFKQAEAPQSSNKSSFLNMLKLLYQPMVYVFVFSAFLYVLIEQGIGSWLPTFNNEILKLPLHISIQVASIFAACLAIGRLSAGLLLQRLDWYLLLRICLALMVVLILLTLPMTENISHDASVSWASLPIAAWLLPLIGLFMAPIYPAINSAILSSLPKYQHASMTGLIVLFSALGGTTGSVITGYVFSRFDGQTAFYFTLIPIFVIFYSLNLLKNSIHQHHSLNCSRDKQTI